MLVLALGLALRHFPAFAARKRALAEPVGHHFSHFGRDFAGLLHAYLSSRGLFNLGELAGMLLVFVAFVFLVRPCDKQMQEAGKAPLARAVVFVVFVLFLVGVVFIRAAGSGGAVIAVQIHRG